MVLVGEFRLELHRTRGGVDLVVHAQQIALGQQGLLLAVPGLDQQTATALAGLAPVLRHQGHPAFRQGEDHIGRRQQGDAHQTFGIGGMHHVALVHLSQAQHAVGRSGDAAVLQLQGRRIHGSLVGLYRAFILAHQGALVVVLLPGDMAAAHQLFIPAQVAAGVLQLGRIAGQGAPGLAQSGLERPGVDLGQQVALMDELTFRKMQALQMPVHPAGHQHVTGRLHRAQTVEEMGHILRQGRGHTHRRRILRHAALPAGLEKAPPEQRTAQQQGQYGQQAALAHADLHTRSPSLSGAKHTSNSVSFSPLCR